MQPTLIPLRGRMLAMRAALILIAGLAFPGAVRSVVGCLDAPAAPRVARWTVVSPARITRATVLRMRMRDRIRQEVAAELGVSPAALRWRSTRQLAGTHSRIPSAPIAATWTVEGDDAVSPLR